MSTTVGLYKLTYYVNIAISSLSHLVYICVAFIQQVLCQKEDNLHVVMKLVLSIGFLFAYNIHVSFAFAAGKNKARCAY